MGIGIVNVDYYELDRQIDVRIEQFCNVSNNYGSEVLDKDARLVSSEVFDLQDNQLLSIIQRQQDQITELQDKVQNLREVFVTEINSLITGKEDRRE